jgi:HAD superfamily hydrolase (TIGR01490 family)
MSLAIFDLDNTLLAGDSDHAFGDFLIDAGLVDPIQHKLRNDHFYHQYQTGGLDMLEYTEFAIGPIKGMGRAERETLRDRFMQRFVEPMMLPAALELLAQHRQAGDFCLLMTATNRFVTEPIAKRLGVDELIATELEQKDDLYTGRVRGIPNFRTGKVDNLQHWLEQKSRSGIAFALDDSVFYSDSFNDLPLLEVAGRAVAVDPDQTLRDIAAARGWEMISLR